MTRIGVISDTHLSGPDRVLGEILASRFMDVDMIIHAGDLVALRVLEALGASGREVAAVCGNMDGPDVRACLPQTRTVTVEGAVIGIVHGWGAPAGIRQRVLSLFKGVDAIVYGHTHQAYAGIEAGVYFFNPGSPTDSRFTTSCSVGIITADKKRIEGTVVTL
jgi:putative phosphoesterase